MAKKSKATHYLKSFCWQHFRKRCKELTPEERREFLRLAKAKSRDGQTEEQRQRQREYTKKYQKAHKEEIREKRRQKALSGKNRKADAWHNSFCWQYFGKRRKDLNEEEVAIYRHLMYIGYGKSDEENAKRKERAKQRRIARKHKISESQKQYRKRKKDKLKKDKGGEND